MVELKDLRNAWLSPHGDLIVDDEHFYESYAFHEQLAICIARRMLELPYGKDVMEAINKLGEFYPYAYEFLEDRGWVRLQGWSGFRVKWIVAKRLTFRQREVISEWCLVNGAEWDKVVKQVEYF